MNRSLPKAMLPVAACLYLTGTVDAQLTVQNNLTPNDLVNNILVGQGVTATNIMFNGQPANTLNDQVAYFNGATSNIGLNNGIVLATGKAELVQGPNNSFAWGSTGYQVAPATPDNTADPDLAGVMGTTIQRCVAVLEFDFIPTGDSIHFRFVFGSEEYPEYACTGFNDGFGFFLSGPGINGPYSNNALNLALVPGTFSNVAINTINSGTPGALGGAASTCAASDPNWQSNSVYYVNNQPGATVELDGFTVPLRAKAAVECGQTYHIKIAIAHAMDNSLDSAVLIEGGSFSSSSSLTATATTPLNDGTLTEGCGEALITITRPSSIDAANIQLSYTGTGITPGDLDSPPAQVTMPGGTDHISFPIRAVRDPDAEGGELLTIIATWTTACGTTVKDSVSITLMDYIPMEIGTAEVWLQCDQDSVLLEAQATGGLGTLALGWGNAGMPGPFYATGWEDGIYTVTATDQCPESANAVVHVHSGCTIWIPNVITPNGDGHNDAWKINGLARSGSSVKVFNRWGNTVYESGNYANNWRATGLPDGTYFYEVMDGRTGERFTGHLTILGNGRP